MTVYNLRLRKAFLVYQVNRLTGMPKNLAETKNIKDLKNIEMNYYDNKHPILEGATDYVPSTLSWF